jgi:hypothetical protein
MGMKTLPDWLFGGYYRAVYSLCGGSFAGFGGIEKPRNGASEEKI